MSDLLENPLQALLPKRGGWWRYAKECFQTNDVVLLFFSRAYVAFLFIHYAKRWEEPLAVLGFGALLLASFLNFRNLIPFLLACVVFFFYEVGGFPRVANHTSLALFLSAFTIIFFFLRLFRDLNFALYLNGLRGTAIVLYFYVGFHKINEGFLDVALSCSTWFHTRIEQDYFNGVSTIPDWVITISPWAVIIVELTVAFMLCLRKTWALGLVLALPVHLYVSMSGFTDFSSLMHAMMILFIPQKVWDQFEFDSRAKLFLVRSMMIYLLLVFVFGFASLFMHHIWILDHTLISRTLGVIFNFAVLEAVLAIWIVALFARRGPEIGSTWRVSHFIFPIFVFVWGALPYLFGSQGSLTMFSNLITDIDRQNHLLIDTSFTKIYDLEKDPILIRGFVGSNRIRARYDVQGYLLPESEFRYISSRLPKNSYPVTIEIENDDRISTIENLAHSEYAIAPWYSYVLTFRQIDQLGKASCRW